MVVRKSLCMSHEAWVESLTSNQMIRLASIAKKSINEGEIDNVHPCDANPIGTIISPGKIFALRVDENGDIAQ